MKKQVSFIVVFGALVVLTGCGDGGLSGDGDDAFGAQTDYTTLQNQVFLKTFRLDLEITQGTAEPSFAWQATASRYVVLAIFKEKIDLKQNQISNLEDVVWTWNTGLGKGREGNVSYSDGVDVVNGVIQDSVAPLVPGTYYIAAWAYSDDYELLYSSKEYLYQFR